MSATSSDRDFERLSWHDNHLYGLYFCLGDVALGDWRSDLLLDIDHIVEWVCGADRRPRFRVAPATLAFHHVTDLRIAIDWGDSRHRTALHGVSISQIQRSPVADQRVCLDRPYYRWLIQTNWPAGGEIAFGASGFTQTLRAAPLLSDEQRLSPVNRAAFDPR